MGSVLAWLLASAGVLTGAESAAAAEEKVTLETEWGVPLIDFRWRRAHCDCKLRSRHRFQEVSPRRAQRGVFFGHCAPAPGSPVLMRGRRCTER